MKVLISGGHLTPALAFIDYLQTSHKNVEILFVGREYLRDSDKQPSREKYEMTVRSIPFIPLKAARFSQKNPLAFLPQLGVFFNSLLQASSIVSKHKPDVFVSFGGYLAAPIALACWTHHTPIVTHEQTRSVGLSNQFIGTLAKRVAVSFSESATHFPAYKTTVTGNLIRKQLLKKTTVKPDWFTSTSALPLLYITGGSQGSEVINNTISQTLPRILKDWQVIHQCGAATQSRSYLSELEQRKSLLTKNQRTQVFFREWVTEQELAWIYKHATASVSRAGANTTQELTYYRLPSVLIPLPFSHNQEQQKNAEALAATGGAIIIPQKHLSPDSLLAALDTVRTKNQACRRKLAELTIVDDADKKLFNLVTEIVPAHGQKET